MPRVDPQQQGSARELHPGAQPASLASVGKTAIGQRRRGSPRRSELQTIDARFSIRGHRKAPQDIVFVAINPQSEQELERAHLQARSPLPRRYDARVIDNLRRAGARAIALDMEFTQQSPNPQEDNELIEAVAPRPRESRARDGERPAATAQPRSSAAERCCAKSARGRRRSGSRSTPTASVRRFERQYNHLGSFPVVAAEVMSGRPISPSTFSGGSLPIDYAGPTGNVQDGSLREGALAATFPPGTFQDKLVDRRRVLADPAGPARHLHHHRRGHARRQKSGRTRRPRCCAGCR